MAVGVAKLGDQSNYGKSPIVPIDTFFKQFTVSLNTYRDDDINVHTHHVKTKDERINVFKPFDHYDYISYSMGPQWIGTTSNQ